MSVQTIDNISTPYGQLTDIKNELNKINDTWNSLDLKQTPLKLTTYSNILSIWTTTGNRREKEAAEHLTLHVTGLLKKIDSIDPKKSPLQPQISQPISNPSTQIQSTVKKIETLPLINQKLPDLNNAHKIWESIAPKNSSSQTQISRPTTQILDFPKETNIQPTHKTQNTKWGSIAFAPYNQFNPVFQKDFNNTYGAACVPISLKFIENTLQENKVVSHNFPTIFTSGQKARSEIKEKGLLIPEHLIGTTNFKNLKLIELPEALLADDPTFANLLLSFSEQANIAMIEQKLNQIKTICEFHQLKSLGATLTGKQQTYGMVFFYNPEEDLCQMIFFDPHGDVLRKFTQEIDNTNAYSIEFTNLTKAAEFLIRRCPYEQDRPDQHNLMEITFVSLNEKKD